MLGRHAARLERSGVHVAVSGRATWEPGKHHRLAPDRLSGGQAEWTRLADELAGCSARRVVLSSESFAARANAPACAAAVARLAADTDTAVTVVAYVRPQSELVESVYCQRVKTGVPMRTFHDELDDLLGERETFDYGALLGPWRDAFGSDLAVFPVAQARRAGGLLAHFLRLLGGADADLLAVAARVPRQNVRLGAKELEVRRLVGLALRHEPEPVRRATMSRLHGRLTRAFEADAPFAPLSGEQRAAIGQRFAAANARFAQDFELRGAAPLIADAAAPRPTCHPGWRDFTEEERRRAACVVSARTGVALPGVMPPSGPPPQRPRLVTAPRALRRVPTIGRHAARVLGGAARLLPGGPLRQWLRWEWAAARHEIRAALLRPRGNPGD